MFGFLIGLILPFLILFFFINPAPEDFYFANESNNHDLWMNLRIQHRNSTGRYFQNILLYFIPVNNNSFISYKIICFLLMLLFMFAIFLSVKLIAGNLLTLKECFLISSIILFSYLYAMPSVPAGFYWYGGLTAYHIGVILIPVFFAFFILSEKAKKLSAKIFYTVILFVLIIAIEGTNEILSIPFFMFLVILLIYKTIVNKKFKWSYPFFVTIAAICIYFLISSPGNKIRSVQFPGNRDFIYSLISSVFFLSKNLISWIFITPLLACTLFLTPLFSKLIRKREVYKKSNLINPFWSVLIWLSVLYLFIFISFFSATDVLDRTLNLIYLIFLAGWFYNAFIVYDFIQKKCKISLQKHLRFIYTVSSIAILFFLIKENNIKTAFYDLLGGSAYKFNSGMNDRFEKITESSSDTCLVDSLINIPRTIFYKDLTRDPDNLSNRWYSDYFNKKLIVLKKPE